MLQYLVGIFDSKISNTTTTFKRLILNWITNALNLLYEYIVSQLYVCIGVLSTGKNGRGIIQ